MKKLLVAIGGFCLASLVLAEVPGDGAYVGINGGIMITPDIDLGKSITANNKGDIKYKVGAKIVDGQIGYKIGAIRLEGEVGWGRSDTDIKDTKGDVDSLKFMANVYYGFEDVISMHLTPYVGAGVGYVKVKTEWTDSVLNTKLLDDSANVFGFQFKAGLAYHATSSFSINMFYNMLGTAGVKHLNDKMFSTHTFNLGILWFIM